MQNIITNQCIIVIISLIVSDCCRDDAEHPTRTFSQTHVCLKPLHTITYNIGMAVDMFSE